MAKIFVSLLLMTMVSCVSEEQKETNVSQEESSASDCICITLFDPVCGEDGEEYSNSCVAECAGVKKWTQGPCEKETQEKAQATKPQKDNE